MAYDNDLFLEKDNKISENNNNNNKLIKVKLSKQILTMIKNTTSTDQSKSSFLQQCVTPKTQIIYQLINQTH